MRTLSSVVVLAIVAAAAFAAGATVRSPAALAAQERGPQRPKPSPPGPPKDKAAPAPLVWEGGGNSASANGMIAVTGSYGVGTSVLYVIDTATRQLAVYEARGGSPDSARLFLVGARRIDLDLQLEGYNDLSEFNYARMRRKFEGLEKPERDSAADHPIPVEGRR